MEFKDLTSKAAQLRFMREKLAADPRWLLKGLLTIYKNQTEDEQRAESTEEHNGIGFNANDAKYLTSVAVQALRAGIIEGLKNPETFDHTKYVSPKQWPYVHKKMQKYAEQLCKEAREKLAQKAQKEQE